MADFNEKQDLYISLMYTKWWFFLLNVIFLWELCLLCMSIRERDESFVYCVCLSERETWGEKGGKQKHVLGFLYTERT